MAMFNFVDKIQKAVAGVFRAKTKEINHVPAVKRPEPKRKYRHKLKFDGKIGRKMYRAKYFGGASERALSRAAYKRLAKRA